MTLYNIITSYHIVQCSVVFKANHLLLLFQITRRFTEAYLVLLKAKILEPIIRHFYINTRYSIVLKANHRIPFFDTIWHITESYDIRLHLRPKFPIFLFFDVIRHLAKLYNVALYLRPIIICRYFPTFNIHRI